MNKIEQVARALDPMSAKVADVLLAKGLGHKDVLAILPMDKARAAIEAMRVPTEGMVCRGEALSDFVLAEGFDNSIEARRAEMKGAFASMIDAALEGK